MQPRTFLLFLLLLVQGTIFAQNKTLIFKFKPEEDGLFISSGNNHIVLNELFSYINQYKSDILNGKLPIRVTGYCNTSKGEDRSSDLRLASIRANRVKAEIIRKGLREDNFVTQALSYPYQGLSDVVVVVLSIPATTQEDELDKPEIIQTPQVPKEYNESEVLPPISSQEIDPLPTSLYFDAYIPRKTSGYNFALSSNLLYLLTLTPNLGLEWRANPNMGILLNGAFSKWDFNNFNKHHRFWMLSPELRCYLGEHKNLYFGGIFLLGQFNMKFSDTGYQGDYAGGGMLLGHQLVLGKTFNLDFSLGLGFVRANYESYVYENGVNVARETKLTRDYCGPTKLGATLIWKLY